MSCITWKEFWICIEKTDDLGIQRANKEEVAKVWRRLSQGSTTETITTQSCPFHRRNTFTWIIYTHISELGTELWNKAQFQNRTKGKKEESKGLHKVEFYASWNPFLRGTINQSQNFRKFNFAKQRLLQSWKTKESTLYSVMSLKW